MAPDPDGGAVVDARGPVHGIEHLHVTDPSIMPAVMTARRGKPYRQSGHGHAGALGHHGRAGGGFKFAWPAFRLLPFC
jgi:hypothetical protein